jgi:CheY-like chemotaxis protein
MAFVHGDQIFTLRSFENGSINWGKNYITNQYKQRCFIEGMLVTNHGVVVGWKLLSPARLVSLVDDERDITGLFKDALHNIPGLSIFTFTEPRLALEHFKTNKSSYALVISDLRMPVINGMQLLKTVKDLNPEVRTVLMTAFSIEDKLFQDYRKEEILNGFVQKPVSLDNLLLEVSSQLHSYEVQKIRAPRGRSKWFLIINWRCWNEKTQ